MQPGDAFCPTDTFARLVVDKVNDVSGSSRCQDPVLAKTVRHERTIMQARAPPRMGAGMQTRVRAPCAC